MRVIFQVKLTFYIFVTFSKKKKKKLLRHLIGKFWINCIKKIYRDLKMNRKIKIVCIYIPDTSITLKFSTSKYKLVIFFHQNFSALLLYQYWISFSYLSIVENIIYIY